MNNKFLTVGLIVVAIIAISGIFFPATVQTVVEKLGATPTLDGVDNPNVRIGGVGQYYYAQALAATSSVPCSLLVTSTSTLVSYVVNAKSNTMNTTFDISTSTSKNFAAGTYGSSSPAYIRAFATPNASGFTMVWAGNATTTSTRLIGTSFSNNVNNSDNIILPGVYLNMTIATTSAGTFAAGYMVGSCQAVLQRV